MKYLKQINLVLMLAGCVVVAYAFSVTFWRQGSVATRIRELPQVGSSSGGVGSTGSPILRRTTTTSSAAIERGVPRRTERTQLRRSEAEPVSGSVVPTPESTPRSSTPNVNQPEETPGGPTVSRVGEKRQAVTVNRQAAEDSQSPAAERSQPRAQPVAPRWQSAQPPEAAEGQKRSEGRNPSTPPVRSSLMGRGPQ